MQRIFLWGVGLATLLALASFLSILWSFAPEDSGVAILALLFFSLFLCLCGVFSLAGYGLRRRRSGLRSFNIAVSLRQGSLLGLLLIGFLLLRFFQIFYWWTALIFLLLIVGIEIAFLYRENANS